MSINNSGHIDVGDLSFPESFVNESVSFTTSAGDNSSYRSNDNDKPMVLLSMRAHNGDSVTRSIGFLLVDGDGTLHGHMSMSANDRTAIPTLEALSWNGYLLVPSGWRVYSKWYSMNASVSCNWQFTGFVAR